MVFGKVSGMIDNGVYLIMCVEYLVIGKDGWLIIDEWLILFVGVYVKMVD